MQASKQVLLQAASEKSTMARAPLKRLVADLGTRLDRQAHSDVILNAKDALPLEPSRFSEIKPVCTRRKIAFVDGGNGLLSESANHLITINRVYFSLFEGRNRVRPQTLNPRTEFFSYVLLTPEDSRIKYAARLFPYAEDDWQYLPEENHLQGDIERYSVLQSSYFASLSRRFAEWQTALMVVESELESGDVLVMDGSLQTGFTNEKHYAKKLYDAAVGKGVIVCGLAKTSLLVTESGHPLLARIAEIARDVPYDTWHIKVADRLSPDSEGFMLAVRLHGESRFVFRFEILRDQYKEMTPEEVNSVLGSLAENSADVSMIGYPYGALDADRFAQVRTNELSMYRTYVQSEMLKRPEWRRMQTYDTSLTAHDVLNGATI